MRIKLLSILILLVLSVQVFAQDDPTRISYGNLSFELSPNLPQNVNITRYAGDPYDMAYPGGPQPTRIEFVFYDAMPAPQYAWEANMVIWLYRVEDFAGYPAHLVEYENLQAILAERPDLSTREVLQSDMAQTLPSLPLANAAQVLRARSTYIDACTLKGISYITLYSQAVSPFMARDFFYSFQAISVDGQYYVSAMLRLNASSFPSEIPSDFDYDAFAANFIDYGNESIAILNAASPDDFSPSLTVLDEMIASISLGGVIAECF